MFEYSAQVLEVHDGDTLRLDVDLGMGIHYVSLRARFFGFDAPELGRPDGLGERARGQITAWLKAHPGPYIISTEKDRKEKYGRYLLARLSAGGHELITEQLAAGFLKPYTGEGPKPTWR